VERASRLYSSIMCSFGLAWPPSILRYSPRRPAFAAQLRRVGLQECVPTSATQPSSKPVLARKRFNQAFTSVLVTAARAQEPSAQGAGASVQSRAAFKPAAARRSNHSLAHGQPRAPHARPTTGTDLLRLRLAWPDFMKSETPAVSTKVGPAPSTMTGSVVKRTAS